MTNQKPVSASHLDLWKRCKRREAFVYRQGRREPFSVAAEAGSRVHKSIELGIPDENEIWGKYKIGQMAVKLRDATPEGVVAREESWVRTFEGVDFAGVVDWRTDSVLGDYKTTSKPKYIKSLEELQWNTQRLTYSAVYPDLENVTWLYGTWDDFAVTPVAFERDRAADTENFKLHVLQPAQEMLSVPMDVDPLSLDANWNDCKMFPPKGCPFKAECQAHENRTKVQMSTEESPLLKKLRTEQQPAPTFDEIGVDPSKLAGPLPGLSAAQALYREKLGPLVEQQHVVDTLFVDCFPVSGLDQPVVPALKYVSVAAQMVADDNHLPNALLVDFGKGPAMIASQLAENMKNERVKYMSLETRSAEGKAVLFQLMKMSRVVVRGMI